MKTGNLLAIGAEGEKIFSKLYEEAGKSEEKKSFVDKLKQWVNDTWKYIKDTYLRGARAM